MHGARTDGGARSTARRRHGAFHDLLRHTADRTELALALAQFTTVATAAPLCGTDGAAPARLIGSSHGLLTRGGFLRMLCDTDISTAYSSPAVRRTTPMTPPGPAQYPLGRTGRARRAGKGLNRSS